MAYKVDESLVCDPGRGMTPDMLHDFLTTYRAEILERASQKIGARQVPTPSKAELANGVPLFLDQLIGILRAEKAGRGTRHLGVISSAAEHGGELLRNGFTVGQVVQDYGSICQSVTEMADEHHLEITADEFRTFNRCLDDAIAEAVTSFEHQRDRTGGVDTGVAHLGYLAHEMRNLLMTAMLTFDAISKGNVGPHGSTGALHGRSLRRMRALVDRTLAEAKLETGTKQIETVSIAQLLEEIEIVATLEANDRDVKLTVDPGASDVSVEGDHQILASVVANLVQNAFKFTRAQGHIKVRAHSTAERVFIDVEDECGGLAPGKVEDLFRPFEQRNANRKGMGLGLTISLKGVQTNGGTIHVHDLPGTGCRFTVDLPRARQAQSRLDVQSATAH